METLGSKYTNHGLVVSPVVGTVRHVAGGTVIDVRSSDPRTTVSYWTTNVDHVLDERGKAALPTATTEAWMFEVSGDEDAETIETISVELDLHGIDLSVFVVLE